LSFLQGAAFFYRELLLEINHVLSSNNRQRIRWLHSLYMIKALQDLHVPAKISYFGSLVYERPGYIDVEL
jgi:hypothetical protein